MDRLGNVSKLAGALLLVATVTPLPARGGVPDACVAPRADRAACQRAQEALRSDVLPTARLRELRSARARLARVGPLLDHERNQLLDEIRWLLLEGRR